MVGEALKIWVSCLVVASLAAMSGCREPSQSGEKRQSATSISIESPINGIGSALRANLQRNFDSATKGGPKANSRMEKMPSANSAGLICSPARIERNAPTFQLVLPPRSVDREGTLAAIAPDGSLHIIYNSYDDDENSEDLVIPSRSVSWQSARERNSFLVDVRSFDAIAGYDKAPELLFREKGIYQFALMNSDARDLLDENQRPFWVIAGCVVHWEP